MNDMSKAAISKKEINEIIRLRQTGHSLPEIHKKVGRGYGTVYKYLKDVEILDEYKEMWKIKRGGSKAKAIERWRNMEREAASLVSFPFSGQDKLLILACLYWAEGNKRDLNLINSDPALIKVFISCLKYIGVKKADIKINVRIYEDINQKKAIAYWARIAGIDKGKILKVDVLKGKKVGKLKYGMCRVRVRKGGNHFKLIMSMIGLIKSAFNAAVVQRIERGTPKP